jgi:hypothetical protein
VLLMTPEDKNEHLVDKKASPPSLAITIQTAKILGGAKPAILLHFVMIATNFLGGK